MLIHYDPDEYETVSEHRTCPFHERNPNGAFAGCTCSSSYGQRRRPLEEYLAIKAKKAREEEDRILAQAEIIKARRAAEDALPQPPEPRP